jgi:predicted N-formylglutamate amidohydrolase
MEPLTRESADRSSGLLESDEAPPVAVENEGAPGQFVIICDHAGRAVPRRIDLGVPASELDRHIAWDIGVDPLGLMLGERLVATVVRQHYSRLVIDCNRDPARDDAMPEVSDGASIPANLSLSAEAKAARVAAIHAPYHDRIATLLDARAAAGRPTAVLFLHSFTPVMAGHVRPWRFGVLHTGEPLALAMLQLLRDADVGEIGDNEPYAMDEVDYTAARHGRARNLDFVELEIRQDLISTEEGRVVIADLLARLLPEALGSTQPKKPGFPRSRE